MTRLLPHSAQPLLDLLPTPEPRLQIKIARILATHGPARPALRALLKSENEIVRNSVWSILWDQRDPSVPLVQVFDRKIVLSLGERDIPELKRLVSEGNDRQSSLALTWLFRREPKTAWVHIRPMFHKDKPAPLRACNIIGKKCPAWVEQEIVGMLKQPEGLSRDARERLLRILRERNCISSEAVALYRVLSDDSEMGIRSGAYECLHREASDESMALLARKALEGDLPAKWVIGRGRDKRLAETFAKLVEEATETPPHEAHVSRTAPRNVTGRGRTSSRDWRCQHPAETRKGLCFIGIYERPARLFQRASVRRRDGLWNPSTGGGGIEPATPAIRARTYVRVLP